MSWEKFNAFMARTPWLAIAGPVGILGTQVDKPLSTWCFIAGCVLTVIYGLYHVNERKDKGCGFSDDHQ